MLAWTTTKNKSKFNKKENRKISIQNIFLKMINIGKPFKDERRKLKYVLGIKNDLNQQVDKINY